VTPYEGDLDDYRRFLLAGDNAPTRRVETDAKPTKESTRRDSAQKRRELKPLKDLRTPPIQIAALQAELAKLDRALADPLLFTRDPTKGTAVSKKRADAVRKLAAAESPMAGFTAGIRSRNGCRVSARVFWPLSAVARYARSARRSCLLAKIPRAFIRVRYLRC